MSLPKYRAIAREILTGIERGQPALGERLPSEAALAAEHGVSLGTVRAALRVLAEQGLVDRRHGSGTFVIAGEDSSKGNITPVDEVRYFRFETPDGGQVSSTKSRVISIDLTSQQGPWSNFLGHGEQYARICRVIRIDDTYEFFSNVFTTPQAGRALSKIPMDALHGASFRRYFQRELGIVASHEEHLLAAAILPSKVSEHTGAPNGALGIEWWIRVYNISGTPVVFHQNFLPPSDYRLRLLQGDRPITTTTKGNRN